jgi:hypothetical protein
MRPIAVGLAIALAVGVLAPATVMSASKKSEIPAAARKQGMAEAPAIIQASGLGCQVTDARFVGKAKDVNFYEVDCAQGLGFVVQAAKEGPPTFFSCIEANTPPAPGKEPAAPCLLPGNADPKADLAPYLAAAQVQCTPTQARGIGQSKTNAYLEVACQEGAGYIVVTSAPSDATKPVQAQDCLGFDDVEGNIKCTLTDKKTRLAVVDRLATAANTGCQVKDRRYIGATKDGSSYFEASCNDGKGYIFKTAANGALSQNWDCAKALNILGGCTLTDAREAATAQAGLYTRLATNAGMPCDVQEYALFPPKDGKEVVEMSCKDGKGGIGIFDASGKGVVLDCGRALVAGYKCNEKRAASGNAALTADLKKFGKTDCTVSEARAAGKTAKGTIFVEVACADGLKGYMIEYKDNPVTAIGAANCAFAGGCQLKGST